MRSNDRKYIEERLMTPSLDLGEAIERLFHIGEERAAIVATDLSEAQADLMDACQDARAKLWPKEKR